MTSGGFIPTVIDVGVHGFGSPSILFNDNLDFFAFQSHRAMSSAAKAQGAIFKSLAFLFTS